MTKTDEYRKFIKQNTNFNYSEEIMAKIKAHNPAYTRVTTSGTWDKVFGRTIKTGEKPFGIEVSKNQRRQLYDISQTVGRPLAVLYQNISGKVERYRQIVDCLVNFSPLPVAFQDNASYYSGTHQDSSIQDGKIIIRAALSEQQEIFALIREIIRQNQSSAVVVEAVSYMVCRHLNIDTSMFTFGYLLEITGFDEALNALRDRLTQDSINNEAEVFIGYLNANPTFLQGDTEDNGKSTASNGTNGNALNPPFKHSKEPTPISSADKADSAVAAKTPQFVEVHTETVNDIDFRFIKIIREYASTLPDISINPQAVRDYGYYNTEMHPIGFNVASRLFATGREIYKLHKDNTEQRINTIEEAKKHSGYLGISKDEWAIAQVQIIKDGVDGAVSSINRWSRVVIPDTEQEDEKRRMIKERLEAQKAKKAQIKALEKSATEHTHVNDDESLVFSASGGLVIAEDDIDYAGIENHKWLESALLIFFEQTGFKPINMPYFANKPGFDISPEMKKINSLVGGYCADFITRALGHKTIKKKNPKTGKPLYNVKKAVAIVCQSYNPGHIAHALDEYWSVIKAPKSIRRAFDECFDKMKKSLVTKPRRETPDESINRIKAADEVKTGGNAENTEPNKGSPGSRAISERNAEIYYIINSYNKHKPPKPKKPSADLPILPAITPTAR